MKTPIKNTRQYALDYIGMGFSVLPLHAAIQKNGVLVCSCGKSDCKSSAKHPIGSLALQGLKNASSDPITIKKWFSGIGQRNIGIATGGISGFVAIDIDPRHGGDASLAALEQKYGLLPQTLRWKTGGGGEHILFKYPGGNIPNSAGAIGPGIDVRGDGGYIVAPPSRHKSGGYYELPEDLSLDTPLAPLTPWLLALMKKGGSGSVTTEKRPIKDMVRERVPEGQRNTTITRISGHLIAKMVDPGICLDLMLAFNDKYCKPPLDEREVIRTVKSIEQINFKKRMNGGK